jgi:DNA-binding protein HU-beta
MNKRDLIERIAEDADLTKVQAGKALEAFVKAVEEGLRNGDRVSLVGFGTFSISAHKAKKVREPNTGTTIRIPARRVARFTAGVELKSAIEDSHNGH